MARYAFGMAQDKSDVVGESLLFVAAGITCRPGCTAFDLTRSGCGRLAHSSAGRLDCCTAVSSCVEMYSVNGILLFLCKFRAALRGRACDGMAVGLSLPETLATLVRARACLTSARLLVVAPDVYKSSDRGRCAARLQGVDQYLPAMTRACCIHACQHAPALAHVAQPRMHELARSDVRLHAVI